jgi:hypothetical protein
MLKEAYELGILAAYEKRAGLLHKALVNPATIGGVLGAGGSVLSDAISGNAPNWKKTLGMGAGGALVGLGVRHGAGALQGLAKKFPSLGKHMLDSKGALGRGYSDLGWMAPSMLALPAVTAASSGNNQAAGNSQSMNRKR